MSARTLQILVGTFFIILGIMGILPEVNEGIFSINNNRPLLEALFGVIELFCGLIMIYGLFSNVRKNIIYKAGIIVLGFWIARIILSVFIWGFPSYITLASGLSVLLTISVELIIASAVWLLAQNYKS